MLFVALFMNVKKTTRCTSIVAGLFHLLSPAVSACFFSLCPALDKVTPENGPENDRTLVFVVR